MRVLQIISILLLLISVCGAQQVDTPAPPFSHISLDHGQITLADYLGKNVYLFFFGWS
jgi:hypothetical protein